MGNFRVFIMVVEFVWHACTSYVGTPAGSAELAAIEVELGTEFAGSQTSETTPNAQQNVGSPRIVR